MWFLLPIAAILGLAYVAKNGVNIKLTHAVDASGVKDATRGAIDALRQGIATAAQLRKVAGQNRLIGYDRTAAVLDERADVLQAIEENERQLPDTIQSPIDGVPDAQWSRLVTLLTPAHADSIDEKNRLGMFALDVRQLCELGLCTRPRQMHAPGHGGGRAYWDATWPEGTKEEFLGDPLIQYDAFRRLMLGHLGEIRKKYAPGDLKICHDGACRELTLSGALALARLYGQPQLDRLVKGADAGQLSQRGRAILGAANGLF